MVEKGKKRRFVMDPITGKKRLEGAKTTGVNPVTGEPIKRRKKTIIEQL